MIRMFFGFCVFALALSSLLGGLYVGITHCWVGGVIDIINGAKAPVTDAHAIAWGLAKFFIFAQASIGLGFVLFIVLAKAGMEVWDGPSYITLDKALRGRR